QGHSFAACPGRPTNQVGALDCPRDETRRRERIEPEPTCRSDLFLERIGSDELEVHRRAQAQQGIVRALARMPAPNRWANPCEILEAVDFLRKVMSAPDEVIHRQQRSPEGRASHVPYRATDLNSPSDASWLVRAAHRRSSASNSAANLFRNSRKSASVRQWSIVTNRSGRAR